MFSRARLLLYAAVASAAAAVWTLGWTPWSAALPCVFLGLFADGVLRARSGILHPVERHGTRDRPCVALTFDDGPDPQVTPAVLDALARRRARATFFVIGRAVEAHPELARRIVREGHELGNHSFSHARGSPFRGVAGQHREIARGEAAIAALTGGRRVRLYRPPFGVTSPPFVVAAGDRGLRLAAWSLHGRDARGGDPARIAARVLRRVRPGDVVLLHDGHDLPGARRSDCPEIVERVLEGLRERGLACVTLTELLGAERETDASRASFRPGESSGDARSRQLSID